MGCVVSRGASTGLVGAASVVVTELLVGRLGVGALGRSVARLALAGGAGVAAERLGAPESVARGLVAGPVLVTALDLGVALIPRRRLDPPPVTDPARAGDPWPPRPPYAP